MLGALERQITAGSVDGSGVSNVWLQLLCDNDWFWTRSLGTRTGGGDGSGSSRHPLDLFLCFLLLALCFLFSFLSLLLDAN
jgi:hypothetical protein